MPDIYSLYYWPIPFRGHFVRMILAHVGARWDEQGFAGMSAFKDRAVSELPYPFMAPPVVHDHGADRWLCQLPAIVMYLGRKHGLSRDPDSELRLICDASDILLEITRGHGAQMWDRAAWAVFREERLVRWMVLHERLVGDEELDRGDGVTLAGLVLSGLWHTMVRALPELRPVLEGQAPRVAALADRVAATPRIARMLATWDDGGWRYCAGEIEQSVLDMLREDERG